MNELEYNELEHNDFQEDDFTFFKKVSDKDKYNFYEYLSIMLDSGV
jgi:type II secretory pathway component PulF